MKRFFSWVILLALATALFSGCSSKVGGNASNTQAATDMVSLRNGYHINTAVLYDADTDSIEWKNTLDYLLQPLALNVQAEAVDIRSDCALSDFDVVYLDGSLASCDIFPDKVNTLVDYVAQGGNLFVVNALANSLPLDLLGAKKLVPLSAFPTDLKTKQQSSDYAPIQNLILDFYNTYTLYRDDLTGLDYGFGMVPKQAKNLISCAEAALYTINEYGKGTVFFTNPLLPNQYSKSSFSLEYDEDFGGSFSNNTASCNQLLLNDYAEFAAKRIYGFSISRVFGAYGSPSMSWELHYEDSEALWNHSLDAFASLAEASDQILSLSLPRNFYVWYEKAETMGYALNQSADGGLEFSMDLWENAYSSQTHVASGGEWLELNALQNCDSYFADRLDENYRLYPCITDYDDDGILDAFCGSADGGVYYFSGEGLVGSDGRFCMSEAVKLSGVSVSGFSAPQLLDCNGDGIQDLIVGSEDGNLYWYRGEGNLSFLYEGILLRTGLSGQALPAVGDINTDGTPDLLVGSDVNTMLYYPGVSDESGISFPQSLRLDLSSLFDSEEFGPWLSPSITDFDGNGMADLVLGTFQGYTALFSGDGTGSFRFLQYITCSEMNYKGNYNLKFGTYSTPVLCDLNGDGSLDLLCGYLEYGMAYPIDCDYFPYRDALQEDIDFALDRNYYIGLHFLTGNYASAQRESAELAMHLDALRAYGLDGVIGANQHTWRMSDFSPTQSLSSLYRSGLLWETGYAPSRSTRVSPDSNAENAIVLPFYLMENGERTLLIQNCSTLLHRTDNLADIGAKYGMPLLIYYHCDQIFKGTESAEYAIGVASQFQRTHDYNFVKEDQMMYSIAAAYNFDVSVTSQDGKLSICAITKDRTHPLYSELAQQAVGISVEFAASQRPFATDAAVWKQTDTGFVIGLDREITLDPSGSSAAHHIEKINLPADIVLSEDGGTITFLDDGLLQVTVRGKAATDNALWKTEYVDGRTTFTLLSDAQSLTFRYMES